MSHPTRPAIIPRFLCVGDTVVDAFIELKDAEVHCAIDTTDCTISMRFGDKIPYRDHVIISGVGNSANASVSVARLGGDSSLVTHLGDDHFADDCVLSLQNEKVSVLGNLRELDKATNYHYVLRFGAERTILVKHTDFTYDWAQESQSITSPTDVLYLSSLASGTLDYHLAIVEWLALHPEIKLVFQPGTFQFSLGLAQLLSLYQRTWLLVLNVEEAGRLLGTPHAPLTEIFTGLHALGPRIVAITDGPKGAYASDGTEIWFIEAYPDIAPPLERTGAGDAFASTFSYFLAQGMSVPEALMRAPINSMNVVQHVGAQAGLLDLDTLESYLAKAPESYRPVIRS